MTAAPSAFALTVSPTRLTVAPAAIGTTQQIRLANGGSAPMSITVQKRNFTTQPDGSLNYQEEAPYAAASWVTLDRMSFDVAPGTSQMVYATIAVPAAPEPGDHQVALVFLVPAGETAANIKINRGIAVPLFVTVAGAVDDSVSLTVLKAKGFSTGGPVAIDAEVQSTGTVHRDFREGNPLMISASGGDVAFSDFTVARGATREITATWNPPLMCICYPKVSITNAAGGPVQSRTIRVIVFPVQFAGTAAGAVLAVVAGAWLMRRRYLAQVVLAAAALNARVSRGDA